MKIELQKLCKSFNDAIERDFSEKIANTPKGTQEHVRLYHEINQRYYNFIRGYADEDGNRYASGKEHIENKDRIRNLLAEHMSEMTGNPAIRIWLLKNVPWDKIIWDMYDIIREKHYNRVLWVFSCAAYAHYVTFFRTLFINTYGDEEGEYLYKQMCDKLRPCFKKSNPYWQTTSYSTSVE